MVDHYYIPHKPHAPEPEYTKIADAVRQAVQGSLGTAFPNVRVIQGTVQLNLTVHIHHGNPIDPPEA